MSASGLVWHGPLLPGGAQAGGAPIDIAPTGFTAPVAFGTPVLTRGHNIKATAVAGTAAFGSPVVTLTEIFPSAITSTTAYGGPIVGLQGLVGVSAVTGGAAYGVPTIGLGAITCVPTALGPSVVFGLPYVSTPSTQNISPAAILPRTQHITLTQRRQTVSISGV